MFEAPQWKIPPPKTAAHQSFYLNAVGKFRAQPHPATETKKILTMDVRMNRFWGNFKCFNTSPNPNLAKNGWGDSSKKGRRHHPKRTNNNQSLSRVFCLERLKAGFFLETSAQKTRVYPGFEVIRFYPGFFGEVFVGLRTRVFPGFLLETAFIPGFLPEQRHCPWAYL